MDKTSKVLLGTAVVGAGIILLTQKGGAVPPPPPPPADIRIDSLTVDPVEVPRGQPVTILVTATNYGAEAGSAIISVTLAGSEVAATVADLQASESQTYTWTLGTAIRDVGQYTLSCGGLTAVFTVLPSPANIVVGTPQFFPVSPQPGDSITLQVSVENAGGQPGTATVTLSGDFSGQQTVQVLPGRVAFINFALGTLGPGAYSWAINALPSGHFEGVLELVAHPEISYFAVSVIPDPVQSGFMQWTNFTVHYGNTGLVEGTLDLVLGLIKKDATGGYLTPFWQPDSYHINVPAKSEGDVVFAIIIGDPGIYMTVLNNVETGVQFTAV